tara:strand:- start:12571 stop:14580 length:2010 start_codon:yes stop_codon:yes gene_type:complete
MRKDLLKIILLVLVISIPFGLKLSETAKAPLLNRVEKNGYRKESKDPRWEFIKYAVGEGRIDLKVNYADKFKEPILLNVTNATVKDSLAIATLIKELKAVFPFKEVAYFSDFIGQDFETYYKDRKAKTGISESFDEIMSYTTHLSFELRTAYIHSGSSSFNINDKNEDFGRLRKMGWNRYFNLNKLVFGFNDEVSVERRQVYIVEDFFRSLWQSYYKNFDATAPIRPDFRRDQNRYIGYSDKRESTIIKVNDEFTEDNEFLIRKIFSTDFQEQFENYMYQTYPWRYANNFIDKEAAQQNATVIVAFMGLLILLLACSLFWNRKSKPSFWNYFLPVFIYATSFTSLNMAYAYLIHIDYATNSILAIIESFIFTSLTALVISFLFWYIEKRIVPQKGSFGFQLLFKLLLTFLFLYLPYVIIYAVNFLPGEGKVSQTINDLQFLFVAIGLTFGRGLLIYLNHFSDSLVKEKDVELSRLKEVNAQSELKLLQSHINPHFLYNALNSIAGLAHSNPDKTEKMALSLSNLFRYSITKKGQKMSPIAEEVLMVQNYLDIEKIRFGDRLKFTLHIDDKLTNEEIPMYILQPLVENAIKHGISKIRGEGHISLEINKSLEILSITISDNGPDFPKGLVSGHGLQTVYDLLRLSYGDKASLKWENTPKKEITISITQTV